MATIDSRIPMAFQSPQINTPNQNRLQSLAIQGRQMELDQQGRALGQENALAGLLQRPDAFDPQGGINPALLPEVARVAPGQALGFSKAIQGQRKALSDAETARLNQAKTQLDLVGQLLGGVTDENSYQAARVQAQQLGIPLQGVPDRFDPNWVSQQLQQTLTYQQRLEQARAGQTPLMRNLAAAGLQPGTPEYTDAVLKGSSGTTVNVGAGEKAWDTESAKLFAKRYDGITASAMKAQEMMGMYDLAEQALASGVRTGLGGEAELTLRQFGAALGLDTNPEKVAGGELVRAVQNRMALTMRSPDGGMGMPGALSDRDIKFLKDSQIGLDRTPEGNRRMLAAFRLMEQRKVEIARLADDYIMQNGRLDAGFNQAVRQYADANPLFSESTFRNPQPAQTAAPTTIQPGHEEGGYRFTGGDPGSSQNWQRIGGG